MEVGQPRVERPAAARVLGGVDIALPRLVVGREVGVERAVMVAQRRGPLAPAVGRSIAEAVARGVVQAVVDVAYNLPVDKILRVHHGRSGGVEHGGVDHVVVAAHADDVGVGRVNPQHGVGERSVTQVAGAFLGACGCGRKRNQQPRANG